MLLWRKLFESPDWLSSCTRLTIVLHKNWGAIYINSLSKMSLYQQFFLFISMLVITKGKSYMRDYRNSSGFGHHWVPLAITVTLDQRPCTDPFRNLITRTMKSIILWKLLIHDTEKVQDWRIIILVCKKLSSVNT